MSDCGGCEGLGSHRRWCAAVVGPSASHLGMLSERAEGLGDTVGANCCAAANALYRAASLLYDEALAARQQWIPAFSDNYQDREPMPSDGPEYHAEHAAWALRQALRR